MEITALFRRFGQCSSPALLAGDKGQLGRRLDQGLGDDSMAEPERIAEGNQACSGQSDAAWLGGTAGSEQLLLLGKDGHVWASGWNEHGSESRGLDSRFYFLRFRRRLRDVACVPASHNSLYLILSRLAASAAQYTRPADTLFVLHDLHLPRRGR